MLEDFRSQLSPVLICRRKQGQRHRSLIEYSRTHDEVKIDQSEEEYVKQYLENYQAHYAVRSAQALAKLGGPEARKALEAAGKRKMREDVNVVIRESSKVLGR